jgi:hypothetical protein
VVNGKEGDSPLTDIVDYGKEIFGSEIDQLVRDVHDRGGFESQIAQVWLGEVGELLRLARLDGSVPYGTIHADEEGVLRLVRTVLSSELVRLKHGS